MCYNLLRFFYCYFNKYSYQPPKKGPIVLLLDFLHPLYVLGTDNVPNYRYSIRFLSNLPIFRMPKMTRKSIK